MSKPTAGPLRTFAPNAGPIRGNEGFSPGAAFFRRGCGPGPGPGPRKTERGTLGQSAPAANPLGAFPPHFFPRMERPFPRQRWPILAAARCGAVCPSGWAVPIPDRRSNSIIRPACDLLFGQPEITLAPMTGVHLRLTRTWSLTDKSPTTTPTARATATGTGRIIPTISGSRGRPPTPPSAPPARAASATCWTTLCSS